MRHDFDHLRIGDKIVFENEDDRCEGVVDGFIFDEEVSIDWYDVKQCFHIGDVSYTLFTLNDDHRFSLISKCQPIGLEELI